MYLCSVKVFQEAQSLPKKKGNIELLNHFLCEHNIFEHLQPLPTHLLPHTNIGRHIFTSDLEV